MNSILPTLFQFFFLVVVIIAFVAVIKVFRRSKIPQEWRAITLLGTLSLMALLSTMFYLNVATWEGSIDSTEVMTGEIVTAKLNKDEYAYLTAVYMPLEKSYKQLQLNIEGIEKFKRKINKLNGTYPNHEKMLSKIFQHFNQEWAEQRKLFNRVNREIRNAVIQAKTQDVEYIDKRFSERAKALNVDIEKRQKKMDAMVKKTASHMEASLNEARKILTRGSSKVGGRVIGHHFSGETQGKLLTFLNVKDPDIYQRIKAISQEISNAERKKEVMRELSMQNKNLSGPLTQTMTLWQKAEESARQHWGDLLYSVEAIYLADQLNMPERNPAYRSLFSTLRKQSERKLARIQKRRGDVEKSFVFPEYVKKNQ